MLLHTDYRCAVFATQIKKTFEFSVTDSCVHPMKENRGGDTVIISHGERQSFLSICDVTLAFSKCSAAVSPENRFKITAVGVAHSRHRRHMCKQDGVIRKKDGGAYHG